MQRCKTGVSIIIPDLNSRIVDKTLHSLMAQSCREAILEILVVGMDNPRLVHESEVIRFISSEKPVFPSVARNIGIAQAKGDYILFIDADCIAASDWAERLLAHHQQGKQVVGGGVACKADNYLALSYNISLFHEFLITAPEGRRKYLPTINLGVTREVVEAVGPFDETLARGEDIDWTIRISKLGCPLYFSPKAVVYHFPELKGVMGVLTKLSQGGSDLRRVRLRYADILAFSFILHYPTLLLLLSPAIATYITSRIFLTDPSLLQHLYTFPAVFLTKLAWCYGASRMGRMGSGDKGKK